MKPLRRCFGSLISLSPARNPPYMSPNAGEGELRSLSQRVQQYTKALINVGDLNSIVNLLWYGSKLFLSGSSSEVKPTAAAPSTGGSNKPAPQKKRSKETPAEEAGRRTASKKDAVLACAPAPPRTIPSASMGTNASNGRTSRQGQRSFAVFLGRSFPFFLKLKQF
jgi:hypothetical protein